MAAERDLTEHERAILDAVIRHGMRSGQEEALAQLAVAQYAGLSHAGADVCFDIEVPDDVPPILNAERPAAGLEIRTDNRILCGMIDLWVEDGRLSSIELSLVTEPDGPNAPWPSLDQILIGDSGGSVA